MNAAPLTHRRLFLAFLMSIMGLAAGCLFGPPAPSLTQYAPQAGDIVFQSVPRGRVVNMIEGATGSAYSHCGVVVEEDGAWFVNEAIGGVLSTPLQEWIRRGRGHRLAVYRLREPHREHIPAFLEALEPYQGRPYDIRYRMDDEFIYCSELVYKAFRDATGMKLGRTVALRELDWKPWRRTIEAIEEGPVPLGRIMITPKHLAEAEALKPVYLYGY